ncbi:DUF423 domain-containing protein [Arenimonas sp.]|uniref:DUF423 domain-containing protein n=1 Tax=Arenimonas sp. TaxID=1872635 RepID=UPI0039E5DF2F
MHGRRWFSAAGALFCGASVALAAYASHGAEGEAAHRLGLAAAFAFAHGLGLIALFPRSTRWAMAGKLALLSGVLLFSGSLVAAVFLQAPTTLAPAGGMLLMAGWAILAIDFLKTP